MPYPTAPGRRMAYDDDGTIFGQFATTGEFADRSTSRAELNDEDSVTLNLQPPVASNGYGVWLFPELREFDGLFLSAAAGSDAFQSIETSGNTTNGRDGTWTTRSSSPTFFFQTQKNYRTGIVSFAVSNVRGLRYLGEHGTVGGNRFRMAMHIYGDISPGETPDRLLFIDESTGLEFAQPWDPGDVPRGSAREFQFRLKNNSTAVGNNLTLNTIQFTAEDLFLGSGAWYTFSVGGDAFAATKQITSLAAEAASALITARQIIPVNAILDAHVARIEASVGSVS